MTSYALLTGVTTVVMYGAAGAAYVQLKTTGALRARAASLGRLLTLATGVLTLACATLLRPLTPVRIGTAGRAATVLAVIAAVAAMAGLASSLWAFGRRPDERPMIGIVAAEAFGLVALALLYYPTVLPPGLTVDQAKAPAGTLYVPDDRVDPQSSGACCFSTGTRIGSSEGSTANRRPMRPWPDRAASPRRRPTTRLSPDSIPGRDRERCAGRQT